MLKKGERLANVLGEIVIVQDKEPEIIREKKPLLHEQLFKEYGINDDRLHKLYEQNKNTKIIPSEWYKEILKTAIEDINKIIPYETCKISESENCIILTFENQDPLQFETELNTNIFKYINNYIINEKQDNPKNYLRSIIMLVESHPYLLQIRY